MKNFTIIFIFAPLFVLSQKPVQYKINIVKSDFFNDKELFIAPSIFTPTNEYNDSNLETISIDAKKNNFQLSGSIKYATPISFSYITKEGDKNRAVVSDFLFLENGTFNVSINDLCFDKEVRGTIASKSNNEYRNLKALYRNLEVDNGSRRIVENGNIEKKDEILKSYIITHPSSYVAMWILIYDYELYGYSNTKNKIAQLFSKSINSTQSFKALLKKIKADKALMVNDNFPYYHFPFGQDVANTVKKSNYTLIEFWSSYCKPCIAQFPELQKIYKSNKLKGFDIYSVSIDRKQDIKKIDSILIGNKIEWKNKIDINGSSAFKLNIIGIPRSFLLDSKGKIIATNISMENLEIFLTEKG